MRPIEPHKFYRPHKLFIFLQRSCRPVVGDIAVRVDRLVDHVAVPLADVGAEAALTLF